jgi:hypothetical protein
VIKQASVGMKVIVVRIHQSQMLRQNLVIHADFLFQLLVHYVAPSVFAQMQSHQRMPEWFQLIMAAARTQKR